MRHGYPTFVDTMGFQNDGNVNVFLENLFEGRVRDGTESNRGQRYQSFIFIVNKSFKHIKILDKISLVIMIVAGETISSLVFNIENLKIKQEVQNRENCN